MLLPRNRRPSSAEVRVVRQPSSTSRTTQSTSVPATSAPWPPAFILTAPPTDPGTPTAHSRPERPSCTTASSQDRKRSRRSCYHSWPILNLDCCEAFAHRHGDAFEPRVADKQIRSPADAQHSESRHARRVRDGEKVVGRLGFYEHTCGATDAVGRQRPDRYVLLRELAENVQRGCGGVTHVQPRCRRSARRAREVRSPAPMVRHRSPGESVITRWRRSWSRVGR